MASPAPKCPFSLDDLPMAHDRATAWRTLREVGSVVELDGVVYLTDPTALEEAFRHPEVFSSAKAFESLGSPLPLVPLAVDPPDHVRYRRILDPFFAPRRMAMIEPQLRAQLAAILDRFVGRAEIEVVGDLAIPYPSQVFLTLFGLPLEDRDQLIDWKDAVIASAGLHGETPDGDDAQAALELYEYLSRYIAERRHGAGDDLMSELLRLKDEGGLTDMDMIGLGFLFVLAGLDTVTAAIGFCLYHLARDSELRCRVVADRALIPKLVEEVLRLELPAPMPPRVTTCAAEVAGTLVPAGSYVSLVLASGNRDPSEHPDPDRIDLERQDTRHYSFGGGIHRCLGSHLARLELRLVVEEFLARFPDFELAPGAQPQVGWPAGTLNLDRLPLVLKV